MEKTTNTAGSDYTFEYFLEFTFRLFSLVNIKFEAKSQNNEIFKERCLWRIRKICKIFQLSTIALACLLLIINAVVIAEDLYLRPKCVLDVFGCFLVVIKSFITIRAKQEILEIFQDLKELSKRRAGSDLKYQVKSYFDGYQRTVKMYAFSFFIAFLSTGASFINFWIFGVMKLSFNYWYPFDPYTPSMFPVAGLWNCWVSFHGSSYILAVDSLIIGIITIIAMEFDILKLDISEVDYSSDEDHAKTFKNFIERHNKLIDITDRFQKVYGSIFFLCFVLSAVMICLSAFQISQADPEVEKFLFAVSFFIMVMGQIFLLCVFGQKLIDSSASVADGIFNSNWIEIKENSSKKQLMLMIQRSQKETKLTAKNFADLSLLTFTAVFFSAGSYYTFLLNIYERK